MVAQARGLSNVNQLSLCSQFTAPGSRSRTGISSFDATQVNSAEFVALSADDEWDFFHDLRKQKQALGPGESGAITAAKFRHATLLSNDKQARSAAEEEGIPISGAIGVLKCAVETESIQPTAAVAILENMICEGAWISGELLELFRQRILHEN